MVTRLVSMLSSSPRIRKHTLFNMLAAFKKIILKTHTSSKTRRCIYLELLSKSNMRNNKKVALEYSLHKHQHEPEKGLQTPTSQPKEGGGGREGGKGKSACIRLKGKLPRQTAKTTFFMEVVKE